MLQSPAQRPRTMSDVFRRFAGRLALALAATAGLASAAGAAGLPAGDAATDAPSATGINAILGASRGSNEDEFLPPDQAFRLAAYADGPDKVRLEWVIHEGYYLYKSRIKVASTSTQAQLGALALPAGQQKVDEYFGAQEVYHDTLTASVPVARAAGGALELPVDITYQGCADAGLCYPPITKNLKVNLPASGAGATSSNAMGARGPSAPSASSGGGASSGFVSEQDWLATFLRNGNLIAVLATFFAIGVGLSLTPCVLPMVPILSGIIVGQGGKVTAGRGFSLAFTYVQGMAITYAAAGAAFVLAFKQAPQAFFQQPWILVLFGLLFVALAFAMFGAYTLQLPSALQTRLTNASNQQKSGTYVGTFIMGALSALVVTACVAPALIAALSVISQTGQIGRGAAALYATGLGMGAPLLVVGASAGSLLPKVGPWMDTVKSLFGVMFLGVAIYFVQPLLPGAIAMLLWSALAVLSGFWIFSLKARDGGTAPAGVRAVGLLALVYGVILLIGMASGSKDPLQPLSALRVSNTGSASASASREADLPFQTIKSVADLQARVAAASAAGKPVMLDFYADWCVSCKEMEKYTFTDASVRSALNNAVLLRADVTANDKEDQALLQHFGIFGPPTIAFYDPSGQEQRNFRVVGYMKAPEFASVLRQAFTGTKAS
jgi:thioredoxin:protein disulfide reductase